MSSRFTSFDISVDFEVENDDFLEENSDFGEFLEDLKYFIENNTSYGKPTIDEYRNEINTFVLGLAETMGLTEFIFSLAKKMGLTVITPQKEELFDKTIEDKEL